MQITKNLIKFSNMIIKIPILLGAEDSAILWNNDKLDIAKTQQRVEAELQ